MEEDEGQSGRGRALATLFITIAQTLSLTFFKQAYILNHFAMILVPVVVVFRQVRKEKSSQQSADGSQ